MSVKKAKKGDASQRIRMHDAGLYMDLMNAADWSDVIEREQRRERLLARRQHEAEAWQLQEQMKLEEARRREARELAAAEVRRRRKAEEEANLLRQENFKERVASFVKLHNDITRRCDLQKRRDLTHARRVQESVYRAWEEAVLRPVQAYIDNQLQDVRQEQWRAKLRREMMAAFLAECNRSDKLGGPHAVYLNVIDEARYNPLQDRDVCTILYPAPPRIETSEDVQRREVDEVRQVYARLALNYRAMERESSTGVLSLQPPRGTTLTPPTCLLTTKGLSVNNGGVSCGDTTSKSNLYGTTLTSSLDQPPSSLEKTMSCNVKCGMSLPSRDDYDGYVDSKYSGKRGMRGRGRKMNDVDDYMLATQPQKDSVMPPLHQSPPPPQDRRYLTYGIDVNAPDTLAEWIKQRRAPRPREADLPITSWERFPETLHGWMAAPDGGIKPSCERRVDAAWMAAHSDVMFDHFTFPRGLEGPLHTGKRVV